MKLRIGLHGDRRTAKNTRTALLWARRLRRDRADRTGPRLHGGQSGRITLDSHKKMDPVRLAKQFEVDMCFVNSGRYWLMDEQEIAGR